jgi:hypothetical protein
MFGEHIRALAIRLAIVVNLSDFCEALSEIPFLEMLIG